MTVRKDQDSEELLLKHEVGDEDYRLEDKHVIVTELGENDGFAVSFQDEDAAKETLTWLLTVQNKIVPDLSSDEESEDTLLPDVSDLKGLKEAARTFAQASPDLKLAIAASIIGTAFLTQLETAFAQAEAASDRTTLILLFHIYKEMVHFCSPGLTEIMLSDRHYLTLFGALEYDPQIQGKNMHFRSFLQTVQFHNVLSIPEGRLLSLMHCTYRVQYLKDTAIARCIDESCLGFLTSLQLTYSGEVITELCEDVTLRLGLIVRLRNMDFSAYRVVGEIVGILKLAQPQIKSSFLETLYSDGVMEIAVSALAHEFPEREMGLVRSWVSDLLMHIFTSITPVIKDYFLVGSNEGKTRLLASITDSFLSASEIAAIIDLSELLQLVLDPAPEHRFQDLYDLFYDSQANRLVAALRIPSIDSEETRIRTIELLTLLTKCVLWHGYRARTLVLESDVMKELKALLETGDKPIALAAIRLLREIVGKNDSFLLKITMREAVFPSVWRLFEGNGESEGMLYSSVMALIAAIRTVTLPAFTEYLANTIQPDTPLAQYLAFLGNHRTEEIYERWNPRETLPSEENGDEDRRKIKRKGEDRDEEEGEKRRKIGRD